MASEMYRVGKIFYFLIRAFVKARGRTDQDTQGAEPSQCDGGGKHARHTRRSRSWGSTLNTPDIRRRPGLDAQRVGYPQEAGARRSTRQTSAGGRGSMLNTSDIRRRPLSVHGVKEQKPRHRRQETAHTKEEEPTLETSGWHIWKIRA
jgi:hypothetical protein